MLKSCGLKPEGLASPEEAEKVIGCSMGHLNSKSGLVKGDEGSWDEKLAIESLDSIGSVCGLGSDLCADDC